MWNLSQPGIKPVSPTWAGGFLTTGPPGKSKNRGCFGSNILLEEAGKKKKKRRSIFGTMWLSIKLQVSTYFINRV